MTKLRQFVRKNNEMQIVEYTWEEIHLNHEKMKEEFRKKNRTDEVISNGRKDPFYEEFCERLDTFLDSVDLDAIPKQYRIEEAKRRRAKGISPWQLKD